MREEQAYQIIADAMGDGRPVALVTVWPPGDVTLVASRDRIIAGTLGSARLDEEAAALASEICERRSGLSTLRRQITVPAVELSAQRFEPAPAILIAGDGPLADAVATCTEAIGRRTVRLDGVAALRDRPLARGDAIVVLDSGIDGATDLLRMALAADVFFAGMLVDRRDAPAAVAQLRTSDISARQLSRLHVPCGLDIGARTPAEIAMAVVAEIIAAERGRPGGSSLRADWLWPVAGPSAHAE